MRLAMRIPAKKGDDLAAANADPREQQSAEVIDLASRNSFPAVTQRKGGSDGLGLAAGVAVVAILGFAAFWGMSSTRMGDSEAVPADAVPAQVAAVPVSQVPIQPPVTGGAVTAPQAPAFADPAPQAVYSVAPGAATQANPYSSPTLLFDASAASVGTTAVPAGLVDGPQATGGVSTAAAGSAADFASRVGGVGGGPASARPLADPTNTVIEGTLIPAVLETAINTDVPGYVRAVVSQDVRSFDGTRVLVPRSSRIVGQYQSGVQQGQKRAYVIWNRLVRPDGVSVSLQSPAVGFDGTTGLQGEVDSHFFKRFGSSILLSVIGGLSTIGTGGASVILGGGSSAASQALQTDGNIGPTIRVSTGAPIRVFTARDLDFSQVQ